MKKTISLLLVFVMILTIVTACKPNGNKSEYSEGLNFISNGDGTCYVRGIGSCTDSIIKIPPTSPDGDTVVAIGVFGNKPHIVEVIIPDSVETIYACAFENCTSLKSVKLPEGIEAIAGGVFSGCSSLESIVIPDSVTQIFEYAFENCTSLKDVRLPTGLKKLDGFQGCTALESITIPEGVEKIYNDAFSGCSSLKSISIPDSVEQIGYFVFSGCNSLTSISVSENNLYYKTVNGNLYSKDGTTLVCYAAGNPNTTFKIPDGVTDIYNGLFNGCTKLKSVVIPDGITWINYSMFAGCSSLESVVIPDSVVGIEFYAFSECSSLKDVYYTGSEDEWSKIAIYPGNSVLENATVHYNYVPGN